MTSDDLTREQVGFNNHLTGFSNGDFNYDGVINFDDRFKLMGATSPGNS